MEKQAALNFEMLQTAVIGKNTTVPPKIVLTREMMERIRDLCYVSRAVFVEEKDDDTINTYVLDVDADRIWSGPISNSNIDKNWITGYYKDGYRIHVRKEIKSPMKRTADGFTVTVEIIEKMWIIPVHNGQTLYAPQIKHEDDFKVCLSDGTQLVIRRIKLDITGSYIVVQNLSALTKQRGTRLESPLICISDFLDTVDNTLSVCLTTNDKMFIAMSDYLYLWNVVENSMLRRVKRDRWAVDSAVVQLRDGTVMVVGGKCNFDLSKDIRVYDPDTMACIKQSKMLFARTCPICACLPNGNVLISDFVWEQRYNSSGRMSLFRHCELYDPEENICRQIDATEKSGFAMNIQARSLVFPLYGDPENMITN